MPKLCPAIPIVACLALARGASALSSDTPLTLRDARFGHAAAVISNEIFIAAGRGDAEILGSIERIPANRSRVDILPAAFAPRYWVGGATDGARFYLAGGIGEDGVTDRFESWTPGDEEPRALAPMPEPRSRVALVHIAGKLYAIGGADADGRRTGRVEIYDIATDTWSRGADMPTPRECDAEVFEGRIVVPGGYDGTASVAVVEFYDPRSDAWSTGPSMPLPQSAHRLVVVDRSLYAFGHFHAPDRVTVFDGETGSWSLLDIGYERSRHNDAVFDGREVYVLGGNTKSKPPHLNLIQHYTKAQLAAAPRRAPTEAERQEALRQAAGAGDAGLARHGPKRALLEKPD